MIFRRSFTQLILPGYYVIIIAFLTFPIFLVVPMSFSGNDFLTFPPENLSLRWYLHYFNDPAWMRATILSFKVAFLASIASVIVGTMAVIAMERRLGSSRIVVGYLISSPIIIPHIFIALGVFILSIRYGFTDSEIALVGAHAMIAMPFVVLIVGASMRQVDETFERAARVLGAGPVRAFFTATFPSLVPAVAAATVFAFFVSFDELIIAQFLLSGKETLPMKIWADLQLEFSPTVSAVAALLIVVTTVSMTGAEMLRRRALRRSGD